MHLLTLASILVVVLAIQVLADKRAKIVEIAAKEIGYHEHGDNCNKFSSICAPWCAFFATWVWKQVSKTLSLLGL